MLRLRDMVGPFVGEVCTSWNLPEGSEPRRWRGLGLFRRGVGGWAVSSCGDPLPPVCSCKSVILRGFKSFVLEECDSEGVTEAFFRRSGF
jgi:hypothetical protein